MKNKTYPSLLVVAISLTWIASCSPEQSEDAISKLREEKDSLTELKAEVSKLILEKDEEIKKLDTTNLTSIPMVSVSSPEKDVFKHYFRVQGVVETDKNSQINAEVGAKILSIPVKEGQMVSQGQTLMKLDSRVLQNNISELKTQIELANTVFEKQKNLWDQNIGSEVQYLEAKTNKESLEAKLATLYSQLEFYHIKAPFSGVVDEISPKIGEMAAPGIPLLRIINLDQVYLKADVSENYLSKVKVGDTAHIKFPSVSYEVQSSISRMGKFINPNNRTFKVRFELDNKNHVLLPNLLGSVEIMDYRSKGKVFIIPTKLLQESPGGEEFIYVLKENGDNRAKKVLVESGQSYQGKIEILAGLEDGDKIIVKGARGIKDGEIVNLSE